MYAKALDLFLFFFATHMYVCVYAVGKSEPRNEKKTV